MAPTPQVRRWQRGPDTRGNRDEVLAAARGSRLERALTFWANHQKQSGRVLLSRKIVALRSRGHSRNRLTRFWSG